MDEERLAKAISLAKQATEKDIAGQYESALQLYRNSLDHWQLLCKYQPNPQLKKRLVDKIEEYVTRAELIKKHLETSSRSSPPTDCVQAVKGIEKDSPQLSDAANNYKDHSQSVVTRNDSKIGSDLPTLKRLSSGPAKKNAPSNAPHAEDEDRRLRNAIESCIVITPKNSKFGWETVAGLEKAKEALHECVTLPARFPELFSGDRKPWKGILLYGPPGTGKTHLARACAAESNAAFFCVSSADLISKWLGESEKLVRELFRIARERAPSVVFLDEVDALCSTAETDALRRVKTQLLVQMEGAVSGGMEQTGSKPHVLILGATNHPWLLDAAVRRRFERRLYIPLPEASARRKVILLGIARTSHTLKDAELDIIAARTAGYSAADVAVLTRDALYRPVRRCQAAQYFKRVASGRFTPCDESRQVVLRINMPVVSIADDPDPTRMMRSLMTVPDNLLEPPPLTFHDACARFQSDFADALANSKPSVALSDIQQYAAWTAQYGMDGS